MSKLLTSFYLLSRPWAEFEILVFSATVRFADARVVQCFFLWPRGFSPLCYATSRIYCTLPIWVSLLRKV